MWAYELWNTVTGNLISSPVTEAAALESAAAIVREFGPGSLATVALVRIDTDDEDGAVARVAEGDELLRMIRQPA